MFKKSDIIYKTPLENVFYSHKTSFLFLLLISSLIFPEKIYAQKDREYYRPRFHFSPAEGWMSDPNGLVYNNGEYHFFYQHLPLSETGGAMHWGHALSEDLLHWEHMPVAIYPDSLGFIFSGCAVVDHKNTSGLGTKDKAPMLAFFTYYDPIAAHEGRIETQSQGLAYSNDDGRTWLKHRDNPIIPNPGVADFRDPKVIWNEKTQEWIMAVTGGTVIQFYNSKNCLDWEYMSEFGIGKGSHVGPWECPDFFPLIDKKTGQTKWVLIVSVVDFTDTPDRLSTATQYFIGDFDGRNFTSDQQETLWIDHGRDCYAGVTFDNEPRGRRVFMAWMQSHQYAFQAKDATSKIWSGAATFPREIQLVSLPEGHRLQITPCEEIKNLYGREIKLPKTRIVGISQISEGSFSSGGLEIDLSFKNKNLPSKFGIRLSNNRGENFTIGFDNETKEFYADRTNATEIIFSDRFSSLQKAPYEPMGKTIDWKLLIDVASIEVFTGNNTIVFTDVFYPGEYFDIIEIFTEDGEVLLKRGTITELKSIN